MNKKFFNTRQRALRFKHFTRKGYSLFSVLGREVLVGVLSVSTLTYAKADGISVNGVESAADSLSRKELKLDEVVVTGSRVPLTMAEAAKMVSVISREDIDRAGAESINDILKLATGVDVRQRGGFGVQTDISVRGGNFDQITILLNGVNISSPHTGHLSADFPVSPDDIERIEVIEGASSRVFGTSAFNGAVNIVTASTPRPLPLKRGGETQYGGLVNAEGGSYGYAGVNGRGTVQMENGKWKMENSLSAGYSRSDGATENSAFQSTRLFYEGNYSPSLPGEGVRGVRLQLGYSNKPYEANTFYSPASRDQWERNERWMAAVNADILIGFKRFQDVSCAPVGAQASKLGAGGFRGVHLVPQLYLNRWYDHYQWHKDSHVGENFHTVGAGGVSLNAWTEWSLGKTSLSMELRDERINSTNLGIHQRYNTAVFFEHDILLRQWTFSLGLLANHNDGLDSRWRFYPGIDVSFRPTDSWIFYASWNMALRMPTFTELYYTAKDMIGNSILSPEKTNDLQLGAKYRVRGFSGDVELFYSHGTDMIDWVKATPSNSPQGGELNTVDFSDGMYHSVNFQRDNTGYEINAQLLPREFTTEKFPLRMFGVKYCYINEDSKYDVQVTASKYAMEYLRHKIILSVDGTIWLKLNMGLDWRWMDRVGDNNAPYGLLDGKLSWDAPRYSIYVNATNILNKEYYDYVSIKQPGFCIMGGMKWKF